jgi:hypothetical protein
LSQWLKYVPWRLAWAERTSVSLPPTLPHVGESRSRDRPYLSLFPVLPNTVPTPPLSRLRFKRRTSRRRCRPPFCR